MLCSNGFCKAGRAAAAASAVPAALALLLGVVLWGFPALAWSAQDDGTAALQAAETADAADGAEASPFAGGSGTAEDPFTIATAAQLAAFRDAVNAGSSYAGKAIALTADIDLGGSPWTPIGASVRSGSGVKGGSTPFAGTFDGGGHRVTGLVIAPAAAPADGPDYALGLFGAVMGGTVKDLVLPDVSIAAPQSELAGGAVGLLGDGGIVSGVTVGGSIAAKCGAGGIVGRLVAHGAIAGCTNDAEVTVTGGSGNAGGIVGAAYYSPEGSLMTIADCVNNGIITGVNDTGGIAGLCCAFVSGCTNKGAVNGNGYAVGGIAGELKNRGGITHCTNAATVTNSSAAKPYGTGGIVGWVRYDGTAPAYALSAPIPVADNLNTGAVNAATGYGVGGIAGVLYSAGTVTGNQNDAPALRGVQFIGGIVGNLQDQGASSLPASVPEGARVANNVSTTPLTAMEGALKDAIAYNNDSSLFTVEGNGEAWVAQRQSTGGTLYASLPAVFAAAVDGDRITLVADARNVGKLKEPTGFDVTLDLNGCNVEFAPGGGITADGGTVTVTGTGDVYALAADGTIDPAPNLFFEVSPAGKAQGRVLLEGGIYPTDVSAYAAPGFKALALHEPDAVGNRYVVAAEQPPAPETPDKPAIPVNPVAPTTPTTPTNPANPNQPAAHGSADKPDLPGSATHPASTAQSGRGTASQVQASTDNAQQPAPRTSATPQTSDQMGILAAALAAIVVLAAVAIAWISYRNRRSR